MDKRSYRQRFTQDELATILRMAATDIEIEEKVRSPRYWTYIVRHPRGFVAAWGRGRSRQACERNAVRTALKVAEDDFWERDERSLGRWRFLLWPPENQRSHIMG